MHLKSILGTGSIFQRQRLRKKNKRSYNYTISEIEKVIEIINLINGKFRRP